MGLRDTFRDIADAIRERGETEAALTPAEMPDAIRAIPAGASGDYGVYDDPPDLPPPGIARPEYSWVRPLDWPDVEQIYDANRDPRYANQILWLLDASQLGIEQLNGVYVGKRSVLCPSSDMNTSNYGSARIRMLRFSDGTVIQPGSTQVVHTFSGDDRYVWVIAYSDVESGKYCGIGWSFAGSYSPWNMSLLEVYGDAQSRMLFGYNGPFRNCMRLRRVRLGTVENTHNICMHTCAVLESVKLDSMILYGSATDILVSCPSLRSADLGVIRLADGVDPSSVQLTNMASSCRQLTDLRFQLTFSPGILSNAFAYSYRVGRIPSSFDTTGSTQCPSLFYDSFFLEHPPEAFHPAQSANVATAFRSCMSLVEAPSDLDLSMTTSTNGMFCNCLSLRAVDNVKVTSRCTNMQDMFSSCRRMERMSFTADSDLSAVTTMQSMFNACYKLEHIDWPDSVTFNEGLNAYAMFLSCARLDVVPSGIHIPRCTGCYSMFDECYRITRIDDLRITLATAASAAYMFANCRELRSITGSVDLKNATSIFQLFASCFELKDVSAVSLDFSNSTDCTSAFQGCRSLESVSGLVISSKCTKAASIFNACHGLKTISGVFDFSGINSSMASSFSSSYMLTGFPYDMYMPLATAVNSLFDSCYRLAVCPRVIYAPKATSAAYLFSNCISLLEAPVDLTLSSVTDARQMFNACYSLQKPPESIDVHSATDASSMFSWCTSLVTAPDELLLQSATNVQSIFANCHSLVDASGVRLSSKCRNASYMFQNCYRLVRCPSVLDLSGCTTTAGMFDACYCLESVPSVLDISHVTDVYGMFSGCCSLTQLPSVLDFSSCTRIRAVFSGCCSVSTLPDVIDTRNCTASDAYNDAFYSLTSLTSMPTHFYGSQKLAGNYTVDFSSCSSMRDGDSLKAMINNLNDVRNGSRVRTLRFNSTMRKLFTADEAADLAATCTAKGWTLTW